MVILLAMQVSNTEKKSEQTFCVLFKILASTGGKLSLVSKNTQKQIFITSWSVSSLSNQTLYCQTALAFGRSLYFGLQ